MSEQLFTCPRCARAGFVAWDLVGHVCRGKPPGRHRRRLLTDAELATAAANAIEARLAATPRKP